MRISDWSSDVCSSDLPKRLVVRNGQADRVVDGFHVAASVRMRGAPSKSGSNARVPESANPAHPSRTLENWRKSWMHPCVRCVSELLARCVASQPRNLVIAATVSGMSQSLPAKGAQAVAGFAGKAIAGRVGAFVWHGVGLALAESPCRDHRLGDGVGNAPVDFFRCAAAGAKIILADPCERYILNCLLHPLVQHLRLKRVQMRRDDAGRSGERRVGKEGGSTCKCRWWPTPKKKNTVTL